MQLNQRMMGGLCALLVWSLSVSAQVAESGAAGAPVAIPPASGPAPTGVGAAWEVMAPMPEARVFSAVAADANGYVYSVGGTSDAGGFTPTSSLYGYDTAANSWATLTSMPVPLFSTNAVVVDNRIYVPGDSSTADTYVYDITGDSWSVIPANGGYTARAQYQIVASDTDVIVLGGIVDAAGTSTTEVWILDTVTETWSAGTPMQQSRTSFSAGLIDGQIVVAGGVAFPGFVPDMTTEIFDGTSWTFAAGVPTGGGTYTRWSYHATGVADGQLWLAAGRRDAAWTILNHAGFYDPASDSWIDSPAIPTLNQGRVYMQGDVASDGYFYVIGGRDEGGAVIYSNNERLFVGTLEFDVGGAVSGLLGSGLVVEDIESGQTFNLNAPDSVYAFTLADGAAYDIQVQTQPGAPQQTCTVANATGVVSGADVTNVDISCTTDEFNVGGPISGLAGAGLELIETDSGLTQTVPAAATSYAFSLADGSAYTVEVNTQPAGQFCTVSNASGTVNGSDVTDVDVACADLTIGISVGQLAFGTLTVGQTGNAVLTVSNPGGGPLELTSVSLTGTVGVFSISGGTCLPTPTTLAPATSCTIEVAMDGSTVGNYQGELVIESTAAGSPTNVGISGSVASPALPVPTLSGAMLLLMMISLLLAGGFVLRNR